MLILTSCVLISRGQDAKTRGHQYIAYAYTDVHIAYSVVTSTLSTIAHQMQQAKSCPGTHTHNSAGTYGDKSDDRSCCLHNFCPAK